MAPGGSFSLVGSGTCEDSNGMAYDFYYTWNRETCQAACPLTCGFRGFHVGGYGTSRCYCNYDNGGAVCPPEGFTVYTQDNPGTGPITSSSGAFFQCFKYVEEEVY
eukprot:scaffold44365_cov50-Cyclotella_meneghiniana.AAC.5